MTGVQTCALPICFPVTIAQLLPLSVGLLLRLNGGGFMEVVENELLRSVVFIMSYIVINYVFNLPFDLYQTFKLDREFGFSTISVKTFIFDQFKSWIMFVVFGGAFFAAISWIIASFEWWWFYGFVFSFIVILFINMIYPIIVTGKQIGRAHV